ncbi:MAG: hypothetical protein R3Y29_05865 [bacterium]
MACAYAKIIENQKGKDVVCFKHPSFNIQGVVSDRCNKGDRVNFFCLDSGFYLMNNSDAVLHICKYHPEKKSIINSHNEKLNLIES